jgi:hypothetical protein
MKDKSDKEYKYLYEARGDIIERMKVDYKTLLDQYERMEAEYLAAIRSLEEYIDRIEFE